MRQTLKPLLIGLASLCPSPIVGHMFTIEHEFDATVVTLIDEGETHLQGDVTVNAFDDCVTIEQLDPHTDRLNRITLSMRQIRDIGAALNLPEGVYRLPDKG